MTSAGGKVARPAAFGLLSVGPWRPARWAARWRGRSGLNWRFALAMAVNVAVWAGVAALLLRLA